MPLRASRINKVLGLCAEHALYYKEGNWYHLLERFPAVLIDPKGYIRFETEAAYRSHPGVQIDPKHIHVSGGIQKLTGYQLFSAYELELMSGQENNLLSRNEIPSTEKALRQKRQIEAIIRNQKLVDKIKRLYKNTCQLCGLQIQIRPGEYYSEVHHIKPLGKPHDGPDSKTNTICVCPNHHAMLDFFALKLDLSALLVRKHMIDESFVAYHNQKHKQILSSKKWRVLFNIKMKNKYENLCPNFW